MVLRRVVSINFVWIGSEPCGICVIIFFISPWICASRNRFKEARAPSDCCLTPSCSDSCSVDLGDHVWLGVIRRSQPVRLVLLADNKIPDLEVVSSGINLVFFAICKISVSPYLLFALLLTALRTYSTRWSECCFPVSSLV